MRLRRLQREHCMSHLLTLPLPRMTRLITHMHRMPRKPEPTTAMSLSVGACLQWRLSPRRSRFLCRLSSTL